MMSDIIAKKLKEVLLIHGNSNCADCGMEVPEYGSFNLGVFLCTACASYHQKIGAHVSKVKSLTLAKWHDDQVNAIESIGNVEANKKYEKYVPLCYRRPKPSDPSILLEQWIRAKYERLEFIHVDEQRYTKDTLVDTLMVKRKRDDSCYSPKRFVLSGKGATLSIFSKEDSADPKICIPVSRINICLAPAKLNNENSMQISYINDGTTRNIFVIHENGKVIIDWYMAVRNIKLNGLMLAYPASKIDEILPCLTNDFEIEGWISKTGPNENDAYRKRWATLDRRKLMYFSNPLDEYPRGEIFLGEKDDKFDVQVGSVVGCKEVGFVFSLITPDRTYVFSVGTSQERTEWMNAIRRALGKPLHPQDNQCRLLLDPTKKRTSRQSWFPF